ncbi:WYL domain-containing protein [Burkholderia sp. Bp8998]|uniref:WYL domain-containing protein n=1 Tax=Burkholderia sp. Bp8998 TaxID=2184557 RepID=UPI000F5A3DBC|nr:WYL domain-containing protein [Burkholderia sp. Bp8998]RQS11613.1 WYL domain-containing protein [Burkholderia sp. Bp8998]
MLTSPVPLTSTCYVNIDQLTTEQDTSSVDATLSESRDGSSRSHGTRGYAARTVHVSARIHTVGIRPAAASVRFHGRRRRASEAPFLERRGQSLVEPPLSDDQRVEQIGERLEIQGTVPSSQRLRWWLCAFGPKVEVLAPASLRDEIAIEARVLAALYRGKVEEGHEHGLHSPRARQDIHCHGRV